MLLLGNGLAAPGGGGDGSQGFTAPMLTVLRLINLTVALAAGSARVTGLDASTVCDLLIWILEESSFRPYPHRSVSFLYGCVTANVWN